MEVTKNIAKYSIILTLVACISAFVVSFTHITTRPILEKRAEEALDYAINTVVKGFYPTMKSDYIVLDDKVKDNPDLINLFQISLENGDLKYVYNISVVGKNSTIDFLACFSQDGTMENIIYMKQRETPGRGDKITKDEFLQKVLGQKSPTIEVDIITGATISSSAMKKGIEEASKNLYEEGLINE